MQKNATMQVSSAYNEIKKMPFIENLELALVCGRQIFFFHLDLQTEAGYQYDRK